MKAILCLVAYALLLGNAHGQSNAHSQPHPATQTAAPAPSESDTGDIEQMRVDLQRLKVLLNQMRNNLAFVDSSQSPLKHQFELEADAWQIIIEQVDRRLKAMEERKTGK